MSLNIKKGDKVVVLGTWRNKDKNGNPKTVTGKVLAVNTEKETVIVEGYNKATKHRKANGRDDIGGIVTVEAPVHVSNVMLICPSCGKATKTGHKIIMDGDKKIKVRVCKKCQAEIKTPIDM